MANNDWKDRLGVVFSTNADYQYTTEEEQQQETLPKHEQRLRVSIEKNGRGGKVVTIVKGFVGTSDDIKLLGKYLKTKCGVGGSVKDDEVIIQGNLKEKIIALLKADGYNNTK
ncbi:MAG: translation initiation factor [Bacteroidaceae bacterium]|nr:translation initiation factor [Bacteroidaceae bacterium]